MEPYTEVQLTERIRKLTVWILENHAELAVHVAEIRSSLPEENNMLKLHLHNQALEQLLRKYVVDKNVTVYNYP